MKPAENERRPALLCPASNELEDVTLLRGLLQVQGHLELAGQVAAVAELAAAWCSASRWIAFVRGEQEDRLLQLGLGPLNDGDDEEHPKVLLSELGASLKTGGELREDGLPAWLPEEATAGPRPSASWTLSLSSTGDEVVGLIVLAIERWPDDKVAQRIRALVEGARQAFTNGLAVRAVRDLVFKDDTAECYNRRYFNEFFVEELARASRFRAPLSLIFFDMDNLKQVNSRHGHAMGSRTLLEVSQRVRGRIRKFDKLFRFGGDEFCIVLPETEWHGALEVAERVRESIAGKRFLASEVGKKGVKMTASFGISSFPLHARSAEELIHRADWAMQRIKRGTKNSIAIAEIAKSS